MDPLFLPQSSSVEREVLACLLLDPSKTPSVSSRLTGEDFHNDVNRFIWDGMVVAHERHTDFDGVVLEEVMRDQGSWGRVSGGDLVKLMDRAGSISMLDTYVDRLLEMTARRRMHQAAEQLSSIAIDGDLSPGEALSEAEALVGRLRESGENLTDGDDAGPVVIGYMKMVHAIQKGEKKPPRISPGRYPLARPPEGAFGPAGWC